MILENLRIRFREERGEPDARFESAERRLLDDGVKSFGEDFGADVHPVAPETVAVVDLEKVCVGGELLEFIEIFADGAVVEFDRIIIPGTPAAPGAEIETDRMELCEVIGVGVEQGAFGGAAHAEELFERNGFAGREAMSVAEETDGDVAVAEEKFAGEDVPGGDCDQNEILFGDADEHPVFRADRDAECFRREDAHPGSHCGGAGHDGGVGCERRAEIDSEIDALETVGVSGSGDVGGNGAAVLLQGDVPALRNGGPVEFHILSHCRPIHL